MRMFVTVLAISLATSAAAQQQDPIVAAQQRYATWKQAKELCYRNAGVQPNEIRFDEGRKTFQIRDSVWLDPARAPAAKACSTS